MKRKGQLVIAVEVVKEGMVVVVVGVVIVGEIETEIGIEEEIETEIEIGIETKVRIEEEIEVHILIEEVQKGEVQIVLMDTVVAVRLLIFRIIHNLISMIDFHHPMVVAVEDLKEGGNKVPEMMDGMTEVFLKVEDVDLEVLALVLAEEVVQDQVGVEEVQKVEEVLVVLDGVVLPLTIAVHLVGEVSKILKKA